MKQIKTDIVIMGAGPAGTIAAAMLTKKGYDVLLLEKMEFPRFVIGESLLPHCMDLLKQADLLEAVQTFGFQKKIGADFYYQGKKSSVEFGEQFSNGFPYTYQVERAKFDQLLANEALKKGASILFRETVIAVEPKLNAGKVSTKDSNDQITEIHCKFILDSSGNRAVLGNLLNLNEPSILLPKIALYSHQNIDFSNTAFNKEKISVVIHPKQDQCWYWVIPFLNNKLSIGVTTNVNHLSKYQGTNSEILFSVLNEVPEISTWVKKENFLFPAETSTGYSRRIKTFFGDGFAIAGNAGEFLDPIFSSGVTIALRSGVQVAEAIHKQLSGVSVDWQNEYVDPLLKGIRVFEAFVQAWYCGDLIKIFFANIAPKAIRIRISSILAGYAWDETNSLTQHTPRRIKTLAEQCT